MRCDMEDSSVSESVGLEGLGIRLTHTCDGQSGLPQFTVLGVSKATWTVTVTSPDPRIALPQTMQPRRAEQSASKRRVASGCEWGRKKKGDATSRDSVIACFIRIIGRGRDGNMQGDQRNVVCICFGYNVRFGWLSVLHGPKVLLTCDARWSLAMVEAFQMRPPTCASAQLRISITVNLLSLRFGAIRSRWVSSCGTIDRQLAIEFRHHTPVPGNEPFLFMTTMACSREM
jgi:hypothetical protein